jgi:hypothetical protein
MERKTIPEIEPRRRNTPALLVFGALAAVAGFSYSQKSPEKIDYVSVENPEDQSPFMIEHASLNTIKEIKPVSSK